MICHARTVNEEVLKNMVVRALRELLGSRSTYQKRLRDNLATVIRGYADDEALGDRKTACRTSAGAYQPASRKEDYSDIADEIFPRFVR